MSTEKRTDVNELGEFGLIDHLTNNIPLQNTSSLKGIGDDAAVGEVAAAMPAGVFG